jgi:Flp pilus assembly protein TadG
MRHSSPKHSCIHHRRISRGRDSRRGAAVVELAILSPLLLFLFVLVLDFGRIFFYSQTVQNAARAGAIYLSDDVARASSPYANVTAEPSPTLQISALHPR